MTTTFPQATLTKKDFVMVDGLLACRPERSLVEHRVLVDCKKGREAITVVFYDYRGCHCSIWISILSNNISHLQAGHGNGLTNLKALVAALVEVGVTFESPLPESLGIDEQVKGVMHSIADAMQIEHPRVITHAWR